MLGVILAGISSVFDEIAFSIGKKKVSDGLVSHYTFGFLIQFLSALGITVVGFVFADLSFSLDSLPTFIPRVLVAILMLQLLVIAIAEVDRGIFGFIRLATIPLLLGADLALGYSLSNLQIIGIIFIVIPVGLLFYAEFSKSKGIFLVLAVAVL